MVRFCVLWQCKVRQGGIKKVGWRDMNLDAEKAKRDIFSIRLNKEERERLEEIKKLLQEDKDGTAVKACMEIAHDVLHAKLFRTITTRYLKRYNERVN